MKKVFVLFPLLFAVCFAHAQLGISLYPLNSMIGIRWNPRQADSSGTKRITNSSFHLEARLQAEASFADEGNVSLVQPELVSFFRICDWHSNLLRLNTGLGAYLSFHSDAENAWGMYVPLALECTPFPKATYFMFSAETDFIYHHTSGFSEFKMRPLFSVSVLFGKH